MAAARKLDNRYGGNRTGRLDSVPPTGGGWGGHTISKSFMELSRDHYDDGRAYPGSPSDTAMKEKYMGPGHAQPPLPPQRFSSVGAPQMQGELRMKQWGNTMDLATMMDSDPGEMPRGTHYLTKGYAVPAKGAERLDGSRESILKDSSLRRQEKNRELTRSVTYAMDESKHGQDRYTNTLERRSTYVNDAMRPDLSYQRMQVAPPPPPTIGPNAKSSMQTTTVVIERPREVHEEVIRAEVHKRQEMGGPTNVPRNFADRSSFMARNTSVTDAAVERAPNIRDNDRPDNRGEGNNPAWQAHWKIKDVTVTPKTAQRDMVQIPNIDFHMYNYIRRFHQPQLLSFADHAEITADVTVKILALSDQTDLIENQFLSLYRNVEENTITEILEVPGVHNIGALNQELAEKYNAAVFALSNSKIKVICDKKFQHLVLDFIKSAHRPGMERPMMGTIEKERSVMAVTAPPVLPSTGYQPQGYLVYGMVKVFIHICDITKLHVNAIVNAANSNLRHHGGIAKAIADVAGSEMAAACESVLQRGGPVGVTQVVRTSPGNLPCKFVIHAVGPRWPEKQDRLMQEQCTKDLNDTFDNIFGFAVQCQVESLAVPFVSSGIFGVPGEVVADALFGSIIASVKKYFFHEDNNLKDIHVVDVHPELLQHLSAMFESGKRIHGEQIVRELSGDAVMKNVMGSLSPQAHALPPVRVDETTYHRRRNSDGRFVSQGFFLFGKVRLVIAMADITKMDVDLVMNPTDDRLTCSENVSKIIASVAGPDFNMVLEDHVRHRGTLPAGHVIKSMPGRLPCDMVLHLSGPVWPYHEDRNLQDQCLRNLQMGFDNMMDFVCDNNIETLAIPLMSGMLKIPDQYIVSTLHDSILRGVRDTSRPCSLNTIYVVDGNPELLDDLINTFEDDNRISDPHEPSVARIQNYLIEDALKKVTVPDYPRKQDSIQRRDYNPGTTAEYDIRRPRGYEEHQRRGSVDSATSSEHDRPSTRSTNKKKKRVVGTKKTKKSQKPKKSSTQGGQHVTVHEKKANPLDCFKTGKSTKHSISIEHPHYDDHERDPDYYHKSARPLSYDSDRDSDDGGFEQKSASAHHAQQASMTQSYQGKPRDASREVDRYTTQRYSMRDTRHDGSFDRYNASPKKRDGSLDRRGDQYDQRDYDRPGTRNDVRVDIRYEGARDSGRDPRRDAPNIPRDARRDSPRDVRRDIPRDVRRDSPHDVRRDIPRDVRRDSPRDMQRDIPRDMRRDIPRDMRRDIPRDVRRDSPHDVRRDMPYDAPPHPGVHNAAYDASHDMRREVRYDTRSSPYSGGRDYQQGAHNRQSDYYR